MAHIALQAELNALSAPLRWLAIANRKENINTTGVAEVTAVTGKVHVSPDT